MFVRAKEGKSGKQQRGAESSSYLRSRKPVRVRPGLRSWARRSLRWLLMALCLAAIGLSVAYAIEDFLRNDGRFLLLENGIRITGLHYLSSAKVKGVFAADLGSSVAGLPLEARRRELGELNWVQRAQVLRVWPNRVWIHIDERRPAAFVRISQNPQTRIESTQLVDAEGVFLETPPGAVFSLPVVAGITPKMPLAERRERLALFTTLMETMDSGEPPYSPLLSEIDLSDLQNVRVTTVHGSDIINLQMGDDQFRHRYALFLKYIDGWKKEFGNVRAVDLRFEGQVAVR